MLRQRSRVFFFDFLFVVFFSLSIDRLISTEIKHKRFPRQRPSRRRDGAVTKVGVATLLESRHSVTERFFGLDPATPKRVEKANRKVKTKNRTEKRNGKSRHSVTNGNAGAF